MPRRKLEECFLLLSSILEVEPPVVSEHFQCTLKLNEQVSVHFEYEREKDELYVYIPIITGMDQKKSGRSRIMERVLHGVDVFQNPEVGSIGIDSKEHKVVFFQRFEMEKLDPFYLAVWMPLFIEASTVWRGYVESERVYRPQRQEEKPAPEPKKQRVITKVKEKEDEDVQAL